MDTGEDLLAILRELGIDYRPHPRSVVIMFDHRYGPLCFAKDLDTYIDWVPGEVDPQRIVDATLFAAETTSDVAIFYGPMFIPSRSRSGHPSLPAMIVSPDGGKMWPRYLARTKYHRWAFATSASMCDVIDPKIVKAFASVLVPSRR